MRIKKNVYTQPPEVARKNGELNRYHESNKLNQQCTAAIHKAITESNYAPDHYDLKSATRKVIDEYGFKRVTWVLANTIQRSYNDGRYSRSNKEWAKGFDIPAEPGRDYAVRSHPCLVDGFIDAARIMLQEREKSAALARAAKREAKQPTLAEKLETNKQKAAQQGQSKTHKAKEQEV